MASRLIVILYLWCAGCTPGIAPSPAKRRVVSLSPAATSMAIALGASDQLVGISTFCPEVPQQPDLPRLGGLIDPNLEAITLLRPNLVLLTKGGGRTAHQLKALGIESLQLAEAELQGVMDNYRLLGVALDKEETSRQRTVEIQSLFDNTTTPTHKRSLLVFAHEGDRFWVATAQGWLGQVAERMGLDVIPKGPKGFQPMSAEAVLKLMPEQIIELRGHASGSTALTDLKARWDRFPNLVRANNIHLIEDPELLQPGASLLRTAKAFRPFGTQR